MNNKLLDITQNPFIDDFPLLASHPTLSYLDSAATAQRPQAVLDALERFYVEMNANPLRGLYDLSQQATEAVGQARQTIAQFINASRSDEIVFTKNATESLNLIADTLCEYVLQPGDEIVISIMEHHSNILPWQRAAKRYGAKLVWLYPNEQGVIPQEEIQQKITDATKIVSITHVSNVLGSLNDVAYIADIAHAHNAYVVVDGSQSIPHIATDVQKMQCDFLAFSAHKALGPLGVGVMWGKYDLLEKLPVFLVGGEMIERVSQEGATWAQPPYKFEAGTQNAAGIFAAAEAINYLRAAQEQGGQKREELLMSYLMQKLQALPYIEVLGSSTAAQHIGVVSFNVVDIHPHDVSSLLDMKNVAIRAGRHCAEPLLTWLGCDSCCRASLAFYNTAQDIDQLIDGLAYVWEVFHGTR